MVNIEVEKGSIESIQPGQENYVQRCHECASGGFCTSNFWKWKPLYFSKSNTRVVPLSDTLVFVKGKQAIIIYSKHLHKDWNILNQLMTVR